VCIGALGTGSEFSHPMRDHERPLPLGFGIGVLGDASGPASGGLVLGEHPVALSDGMHGVPDGHGQRPRHQDQERGHPEK
jgi:hypothetical protein